jgi:protoporphyrinogen/coproporphyrinogen III oxidase
MKRIAVVGGGAAALAAAWRLSAAGVQVTLYEAAAQIGGRARSELLEGCIVDTGAQLFGSGFSALFGIAREVGAESLLVRSPGRDALLRNGRKHPITYGSVSSMITSGALPTRLKMNLGARYVPFLLRNARQLDASDPVAAGGDALDTASVAEWGTREIGAEFVELLAYPLLGAYYGSTPERTSAALYHALARAGVEVSVHAVKGGTGALMRAIADAAAARGAEIRTNSKVTRVTADEDSARIAVGSDEFDYDGAIIAIPAPQVPPLIDLPKSVLEWLGRVEYARSAALAVVLKRPLDADFFGLSLLRTEPVPSDLVAVCVEANKTPGLVPADRGLLVCLGAPDANATLIADPERGVERMIGALEHIFPGVRQHIERVKLYRHSYGYPVFYPGYLKHLRAFPGNELPAGIRLAGDYLVAPTVEGAIRSGERAAQVWS